MILRDDIAHHRKFLVAGELIGGVGGPARALGLWVAAIGYAREHLTDGFIDDAFVSTFALDSDGKLVANALSSRRVRLLHRVKGGYQIHDFQQYNGSAANLRHQRKLARERQRRQRAGKPTVEHVEHVEPPVENSGDDACVTHVSRRDSGVSHAAVHSATDTEKEREKEVRTPKVLAIAEVQERERDAPSRVTNSLSFDRPPLHHGAYQTGLVNVPVFIHQKLVARLVQSGTPQAEADTMAFAFYARECAKRQGHRIGDTEPKFWDARIAEWLGTTSTPHPRPLSVGLHNAAVLERRRGHA